VCGGRSDATLERCPFCGVDDNGKPPALAAPKTNGRALVKVGTAIATVLDEKALDRAVDSVNRLKGEGALWAWKLGRTIYTEIYTADLWRQRTKDGVGVYRSFDQFIDAELNLAKTFVYTMMKIGQYFEEKDVLEFGTSHLRSILAAPKEDHKMLLAKIKEKGLSARAVAEEVAKIRKRKGIKKITNPGVTKRDAKLKPGTELVSKKKRVTLSLKQESHTVKLACEPGVAKKIAALLETLSKKPHGVLAGENDAEMRIKLLESGGNLVLVVEPRRTDEG
jgi:arginine repressor